ncbi:hypothetical protein BCR15_04350 [Tessaracoccus lapidicaptus]|jgi:DNA-binding LacI/PurR family transcriptional regulator|uniref:Uncharacterized protein n=1 Tax=Tessaracoccus lapidicaptus TaxID=1427523 RepID=A0A1C0AM79_9ACTN|nr:MULTISPECIES: LacI family DNA-binding transcriptional regulator [Tessaracoccus]AQX15502.1 LacI family transcriptional regulator [Tessaracoccus sp. T2.5-30]OCL33870.1 hypothetical protein BCR15_04350 [Tessaracoccus lapidicaptus]VEP39825.1 putative HTH-type transcriptional repressor ExuR [Tessaracoccus lapidicaptus]
MNHPSEPSARRLTIAEIAARAKVSPTAVSFALNGKPGISPETRDRILEVVRQSNWRPNYAAQALSMSKAGVIGVVTIRQPGQPLWSASFGGHFLAGVQAALAERGVLLILHTVDSLADESALYERWMSERRVDGVLVINPHVDDPRLRELERVGLPAVIVGDTRDRSPLACVWTDDEAAAERAVGYLAELGHTHIARIGGDLDLLHYAIRERAFMAAARRAGVRMSAETIDADAGAADAVALLADRAGNPLTAVIVEDLEFAVHLTGALISRGIRVPQDVSVLAWDDGPAATLVTPTLTSLSRDIAAYGSLAAQELLDLIGGAAPRATQGTTTDLIVRESTSTARG